MGQVGKPSEYIGFSAHNNIIIMFKHLNNQPNYQSPLSSLFYPKNSAIPRLFIPKGYPKE